MYKNNDGKRVSGSNAAVELRDGERLDLWQTPVNASSLRSDLCPWPLLSTAARTLGSVFRLWLLKR